MKYNLKNGTCVEIRQPDVEDAQSIIDVITKADTETMFLAREAGEFKTSLEREKQMVQNMLDDSDQTWFIAECDGRVVGQCSIGLVRRYARYRHRAEVAFVLLKDYCDLGIGGKMMQECIKWAKSHNVTQIELDVVVNNERAIKMYENFGFEKTGVLPLALCYKDGTTVDEYYMVMKL